MVQAKRTTYILFLLGTLQAIGGFIFVMIYSLITAHPHLLSPFFSKSMFFFVCLGIMIFIGTFYYSYRTTKAIHL